MKVCDRICVKEWEVKAKNGDYWKAERGKEYTTSPRLKDGTVKVFSNFWVHVPADCFGGPVSLEKKLLPDNWECSPAPLSEEAMNLKFEFWWLLPITIVVMIIAAIIAVKFL